MDLTTYTDDDLDALRVQVLTEQERRATLASAPQQAAQAQQAYTAALGRQAGSDWAQPAGAHDAYMAADTVTHKGKVWDNAHGAGNAWEPGVYGWTATS